MADRILVPLGNGAWLALTQEQLNEGLKAGASMMNTPDTQPQSGELLDAAAMEQRTGVKKSLWMSLARANKIPHQRIGRYVRFDLEAIKRSNLVPAGKQKV